MAMLINCPACAKSVSDAAPSCPNCGQSIRPMGGAGKAIQATGLLMTFGGLFGCIASPGFFLLLLVGMLVFAAGRFVAS